MELFTQTTGANMKTLSLLSLLIFATSSYAFQSDDKIKCWDSVSNNTYSIKIVDLGDEEAYIKVRTNSGKYFYPARRVIFDESNQGATFAILSSDNTQILEEIFVSHPTDEEKILFGEYTDGADSRGLECRLL